MRTRARNRQSRHRHDTRRTDFVRRTRRRKDAVRADRAKLGDARTAQSVQARAVIKCRVTNFRLLKSSRKNCGGPLQALRHRVQRENGPLLNSVNFNAEI